MAFLRPISRQSAGLDRAVTHEIEHVQGELVRAPSVATVVPNKGRGSLTQSLGQEFDLPRVYREQYYANVYLYAAIQLQTGIGCRPLLEVISLNLMRPKYVVQCLLSRPISGPLVEGTTYQRVNVDADRCPRVGGRVQVFDEVTAGAWWTVVEKDTHVREASSINFGWDIDI